MATITWTKAFQLIEDATAIRVMTVHNELNYPEMLEDETGMGQIVLHLNEDVNLDIYQLNNETVEIDTSTGHFKLRDINGDIIEIQLLKSVYNPLALV